MEQKYPNIHRSEWDWIGCDVDYELDNNKTINELGKQVDKMLTDLKISDNLIMLNDEGVLNEIV